MLWRPWPPASHWNLLKKCSIDYNRLFSTYNRKSFKTNSLNKFDESFSANISFTFHATSNPSTLTNVLRVCENFWMIFGHFWKKLFFLKDMLNCGKYETMKIWWIWKIEIWIEELVDVNSHFARPNF